MSQNLTLRSIGEACGVSHITVSRALRGDNRVKPDTARRICQYTEEIGYKPNVIARSLAQARSDDFHLASSQSIIIPYNEEPINQLAPLLFWDYVEGAVNAASKIKSSVEVMGFNNALPEFEFIRALVEEKRIAGVLDLNLRSDTISYLINKQIPLVSRLRSVRQIGTRKNASVYPDHIQGYVLAWHYLLERGHRCVGYIMQKGDEFHLNECLAATHLLDEQPRLGPVITIPRNPSAQEVYQELVLQLGKKSRDNWPTVFFCSNDDVAHQTIIGLSEARLHVPGDVSIFGFDDSQASRLSNPPICTVRNPRKEIGAAMVHLLKDIIAGRPDSRNRVEVLPMELVPRKSVALLR